MNRTSRSSRLVRSAARSPALAITGPEVERKLTPSSRAMICASVVLPRPGGPTNSTWSSASPRFFAASMNIFRLARAAAWPTNSSSDCGRSETSTSSPRLSGEMRRAAVFILVSFHDAALVATARSPRQCLQAEPDQLRRISILARRLEGGRDGAGGDVARIAEIGQRRHRVGDRGGRDALAELLAEAD